ncbi:MAG: ABC transporter ATP-binding protein [Betaproteobacteria bacterium]|nr:MAG: ABC transporter ATP-binding protein [Betaproteobacteria bacterium]
MVAAASATVVDVRGLTQVFDDPLVGSKITALNHVSFRVRQGEFVSLLGPSGCGKSTILNLIAGFLEPTGGEIWVYEKPVRGPAPERGVCFQEAALFPWLRVLDNVLFGPQAQGRRDDITAKALELLRRVGLEEFKNHYPHQLSGGMKQRVAIARLLMNNPQILLMDEPFGALDALTRLQIQEYLLTIHQEFRKTVVFVTHDIDEAVYTSDRILVMCARPGRIEREITIEEPRPRKREFLTTPDFLDYKRQALAVLWGDKQSEQAV